MQRPISAQAQNATRPAPASEPTIAALARVVPMPTVQTLAPGGCVFFEGDAAEHVYDLVEGVLRLSKLLPDGRRQILGFCQAGALVGFVPGAEHAHTAEAVTAVKLRRYPRAKLDRLIEDDPSVGRRLLARLAQELRAAEELMLLLGRKSAAERLASFLLALAATAGGRRGDGLVVELPMSRGDIGDYLGLTLETVSRVISQLKARGLIALPNPHRAVLLQPAALRQLAAGEALLDRAAAA
jgi:CRP/FNR family transcriptional regulator